MYVCSYMYVILSVYVCILIVCFALVKCEGNILTGDVLA